MTDKEKLDKIREKAEHLRDHNAARFIVGAAKEKIVDSTAKQILDIIGQPLKPCPFCGGEAEVITINEDMEKVGCPNCSIHSEAGGRHFFAMKWNKRV